MLKITYFSPLFPAPAGIADYSRDLLPSLSEKVDLNLFAEDPAGVDSTLHEQFPVEPIAAYPDKRWDSDLAWQIRLGRRMRPVQSVHFSKRIVDRSPSIIVHSHDAAERFSRRSVACPVAVIPHLVAGADGSLLRHRLELPDRTVLFATTILVNASKRIDLALDAFVRLKQAEPNVFFLIVGGVHTDVNLPKMIHQRRLQDSVHCTGRVAIEELNGWVAAADVVIALRHPTLGETSGAAVRALSTGKPLIVFDDGWYGELPAEICLQIPPWMLMR